MSTFPILYHTHLSRHVEDIPFWLSLAELQGDPVLELGCGTGRVLLKLATNGRCVFGLDKDLNMLAVLKQNLATTPRACVHIIQGDLANFHFNLCFPLILLPCNTLSTLAKTTRKSMYGCVCQHLNKGGLFVASLPNPTLLANLAARAEPEVEEVFTHPLDGEPVQVVSAWRRTTNSFRVYWHYDHLLSNGEVDRTSIVFRYALIPVQAYLDEFEAAGLRLLNTYGDYDFSAYREKSPYLILAATH